jgi:hypothetical protein
MKNMPGDGFSVERDQRDKIVRVNLFSYGRDGFVDGCFQKQIKSQLEGLQLAEEIRAATLAQWPAIGSEEVIPV